MSIHSSYCYDGSPFQLAFKDTIAYISGGVLYFWDTQNNKKDYIQSSKNGFQCFTCHHSKQLVFAADYGLKPVVQVFTYPEKKQIQAKCVISDLQIIQMDVSVDANKLLVVSEVPNYEITVFDTSNCWLSDKNVIRRLEGEYSSVHLKSGFIKAQFSPQNNNIFAVLYENVLELYEILPTYEFVNGRQEELDKKIRINKKASYEAEGQFSTFIWDEQNRIYLADKFNIVYLDIVFDQELNQNELKPKLTHESFHQITHFVLTQKHIIVIHENGLIEWLFKYHPKFENDEDQKPFKFDKRYQYQDEKIINILYNQDFTKMVAGTQEGSLLILPEVAETLEGEEEEENLDNEQEGSDEEKSREIDIDLQTYGPFHVGSVIFIKELKKMNCVLTISSEGRLFLWNIQKQQLVFSHQFKAQMSSACLDNSESILLIGSQQGVIRILDVSDFQKIQMVKKIRLFKNKAIEFLEFSKDQSLILAGSSDSKKAFFLSTQNSRKKPYRVVGYSKLPYKINYLTWNSSNVHKPNQGKTSAFALVNFFLIAIIPPNPDEEYKELNLGEEVCPLFGRKTDNNLNLLVVHPRTGDVITTGKDKMLKRYQQPDKLYQTLDLKLKAGEDPLDEVDGHSLQTNIMRIHSQNNQLISGAQDGTIFIRDLDNLMDYHQIKGHNLKYRGVSYLEFSQKYPLCYSGGNGDGSFFVWKFQNEIMFDQDNIELPPQKVLEENQMIMDVQDNEVIHYQQELQEEFIRSQKEIREKQKQEIQSNLMGIKSELEVLLNNNENAEELEKLKRDDFVIDIETRDQILKQGEIECEKIRENAQKENYKQEILHNRLLEKTWNTMKTHLKAINGLDTNIIVYNYHIRQRSEKELQQLKWIQNLRKIELKEQKLRKENQEQEIVDIFEFIDEPNKYIVNGVAEKPQMVLIDYEAQEEAKQQEALQAQKQKINTIQQQPAKGKGMGNQQQAHGHGHGMGRQRFNQQAKPKQQVDLKKVDKEKEEAEQKKKEQEKKQESQNQEQENNGESAELNEWKYLYGALELFTNNRKRNQIRLLHNIIFSVKEEFNKEFEKCMAQRSKELDQIQDRNKKIEEIYLELHKEPEYQEIKQNILEQPEKNILEVDPEKEISFKKFLTREDRKKIEEARLKEEERLKALLADDAGRRAVQQMMDGTIEEKKENLLDEEIKKEEWMDLPEEELNDEQKIKLKEYEVNLQKQQEEKDKIRKNLESQLKKLKQEIVEICQKFDQKLLILFRRKLEFDYRIYEQELYIVKLSLSMIEDKYLNIKLEEISELSKDLSDDPSNKLKAGIDEFYKQELARRQQLQREAQNYFKNERALGDLQGLDLGKLGLIWTKVFKDQKSALEKKQQEEKLLKDENYKSELVELDPLFDIKKNNIMKSQQNDFNNYKLDIQQKATSAQLFMGGYGESQEEQQRDLEILYNLMRKKFELEKEYEQAEANLNDIDACLTQKSKEASEVIQQENLYQRQIMEAKESLANSKSNIEVILRFKQGLVEINNQNLLTPSMEDAILITRQTIEQKNRSVQKKGDKKIRLMEEIKTNQDKVSEDNYNLKKLEKSIEKVENEIREIQLLKVKKEMQIGLQVKNKKLQEEKLQDLSNQIKILVETAEKRIKDLKKKEDKIQEQIYLIEKENDQLISQQEVLKNTVQHREKLVDLYKKNTNQNPGGNKDNDADESRKKFEAIARNRKLYDLGRRQIETIEAFRDELNKLKAKTFANFSVVNK
ncbi:WD40-repeat-containing domain [Pseudocohnilembus persalinus]|uniref:Cilia- and flagella-associated protein 43 n=1 Tax=Pseudocohnilembus persalinus TaxID=266149 RepID=A0A0V0QLD9_PSEPJ|nr:WD40-repeat-containing domain [Pseudocohnilembus persalinus]|eukprot:KRX02904.1 WD40-repeat-containing domain [Pseudocohnilembus persalinus]